MQEFVHQLQFVHTICTLTRWDFQDSILPWMTIAKNNPTCFICVVGGGIGSETISTAKGQQRLGWVVGEDEQMERKNISKDKHNHRHRIWEMMKTLLENNEKCSGYRWNINGFVTYNTTYFLLLQWKLIKIQILHLNVVDVLGLAV